MVSKLIVSLVGAALMASSAVAQEYQDDDYIPPESRVVVMRSDCARAAQQAVKLTGGELLSVRPARNGKPLCSVTLLVLNAKGRPKKVRMAIPMDF